MSDNFKENLRKTIKESKEAKERHQDELDQFANTWHRLKDSGWVASALRTAVTVLTEEKVHANIDALNSRITLAIYKSPKERPQHSFTLTPDKEKMRIILSSSANQEDELFDLAGLDESTLKARISDFVRVALGPEQSTQ
ncbi:MAG TPA: hypothetical protein VF173_35625 [Thermoanaerobaculia bacterium]|nr:hypothetical protein [Thermoanaerobaculia bacterium]